MPSAPTIRLATRDELPAVGLAMARAFADDPVYRWIAAPTPKWEDLAARWFEAEARVQFEGHGQIWVDDDVRGAAVWCEPGHWRSGGRESLSMIWPSIRFLRGRTLRGIATITLMEKVHPVEPEHWYLALLGTDPAHQGHGIGSALIRAVTDRCDATGTGAYLESSKESNLAFYGRHGFVARDPLHPRPGAPPLLPMWRDPREPAL